MKIRIGANIMKNDEIQAVHDNDLKNLLKSLNVYEDVINNNYHCLFCDSIITLDNIDSIVPYDGEVQFTCDRSECHLKLLGWR